MISMWFEGAWLLNGAFQFDLDLTSTIEVDQSEGRFLAERPEDSLRCSLSWRMGACSANGRV